MKISIQGIRGAFHEAAARQYFSDDITIIENLTFEEVIRSVENKESQAGIMAIENTISGTIHSNLELIKESSLLIVGEINLRIVQNLVVNKGVLLSDLKQVESHYMAINQCRSFFENYPEIRLVASEDTALSMRCVSEKRLLSTGAIGSALAAAYYDLEIVGNSIETDKKNFTRFLIIGRQSLQNEYTNKSTIQFVLKSKKGELSNVLNSINNNNINLIKIESLPVIGKPWNYQFYIDVLYKSINDYNNMLKALKPYLESLSVLGNYSNNNKN